MSGILKYLKFDELMSSVESDMSSFADNGLVDKGKVIKIVRRVNSDLGLKINKEKERVINIENYVGKLPSDFYSAQHILAFDIDHRGKSFHKPGEIFGTVTQEYNTKEEIPVETLDKGSGCLNQCGGCYWVTQLFEDKVVRYYDVTPVKLSERSRTYCGNSFRNYSEGYSLDISNAEITTEFKCGKIYMRYVCDMVDEDDNLLVLDHDLTRDYYEYAIKKHLLENYMLNNDADVSQKLGYIKNELREARIRAISFVNTPEYSEIKEVFEANRMRFYRRYNTL